VEIERPHAPLRIGEAEILRWGDDGMIICLGTLLPQCVAASERLRKQGMDVGVINARFAKPLDQDLIGRALRTAPFVITVEEAALMGGFGSAVLELANQEQLDTRYVKRLGIPDQFVEHGDREELLADLGLNDEGIMHACQEMAERRRLSDAKLTE
jgi:1-deoxy-D-xylulose-5-phosphate synthase